TDTAPVIERLVTARSVRQIETTVLEFGTVYCRSDATFRHPSGVRTRAFEALPPDERELVGRPILAGEKIPERMLNRLTVEAARAKGDSLEQWGRRAGRAEFADSVGVYRFFVMVLTPASMMRKASSFWSTVHSQGNLAVESQEPHKAKVILTQFSSEPAHCARLAG
ncbi:MAG: hypothetical protein ABR524_14700, partial [Thermoanaerobaculia bacterium]